MAAMPFIDLTLDESSGEEEAKAPASVAPSAAQQPILSIKEGKRAERNDSDDASAGPA
jgi:hypothetical protein